MAAPSVNPGRRLAGRVVAWVLGGLAVVAVLAGAWIAISGALALGHMRTAEEAARGASVDLSDLPSTAAQLARVSAETSAARGLTSGPVWDAAKGLPWIGPQLSAATTTIAALDDVAGRGLRPLADAAQGFSLDALRPQDGAVDLAALGGLHDAAESSAASVARSAAAVDGIDRSLLLAPLREPIGTVADLLDSASTGLDALRRATAIAGPLLGADGPRDYLVVFQNNAEWRSLGGIVGAMAVLHTDDGRLSLAAQGSSSDFTRYDEPVLPLSDEALQVFSRRPALYIQNATQVPDYPFAAQLAREMWARETGLQADGVISLDPVALPTGDTLTSDDAVDLLLNGVYQRYEDPREQDAFFAATTAAVFAKLAGGDLDPAALVRALSRAADERRLLVWSTHPEEESIVAGTTVAGELPVTDASRTAFGVYLNDGTGSKMDYYMNAGAAVAWCHDTEGSPDAELTVTLRNDAPADAASLPSYITGGGAFGVARGKAKTVVYLLLPEGSALIRSDTDGVDAYPGFGSGTYGGRSVLTWTTELAPGEQSSAILRVRTPETPELVAEMTPTIPGRDAPAFAGPCAAQG